MRLLYLQQLLVLPGQPGNARCWQFARQWTEAGHHISFLTSTAGIPSEYLHTRFPGGGYHFLLEGVEIYALPVPYAHQMPFWRRIIAFVRFFQKARPLARHLPESDAILAYSAPLSVGELGRQLAKKRGVPFFFEVADVWPDVPIGMGVIPKGWLANWLLKRTRRMYEAARLIFPYSSGMARQIMQHGVDPAKIHLSPNGVKLSQIPFQARIPDPGPVQLIYTGTIGRANDLTQVIRAIHWIEQQQPHLLRLTIVGSGNEEAVVKKLAAELKLQSVEFRGQTSREEATRLLQKAEIGLISFAPFPVLEANGATKFFDYLASGLPIVINYGGWQAELLARHSCGRSARQGEIKDFAKALMELAQDAALRQEMGKKGRELAEQEFDRRDIAQRMLNAMVQVVSG